MIYAIGVLLLAIGGLFIYSRHDNREIGKQEEKNQVMSNTINEVKRAKIVRDALNNDPTFLAKLRGKYERE